jgi:hypothetical protein
VPDVCGDVPQRSLLFVTLPASQSALLQENLEFQEVILRARVQKWCACAPSGKVLSGRALRRVTVWEMGIFECRRMMLSKSREQ